MKRKSNMTSFFNKSFLWQFAVVKEEEAYSITFQNLLLLENSVLFLRE